MFIVVTLFCLFAGWFGAKLHQAERQRTAVLALTNRGCYIEYDYERDSNGADPKPRGPELLREWLGRDFFNDVVGVSFDPPGSASPRPSVTDADFELLFAFPRLRGLELGESALTDASLGRLTEFSQLDSLIVTDVTDAWMTAIARCKTLKSLIIYGDSPLVTCRGLARVGELTNLEMLSLPQCIHAHFSNAEIEGVVRQIARLRNLRDLCIENSSMTDASLERLAELHLLEVLHLDGLSITDRGLQYLSKLKNLRELYVAGTMITDAGLRDCAFLNNLTSLDLAGTLITDGAFIDLERLTRLRYLTVTGTRLSPATVERLRLALPKTYVWAEKRGL